ncbi:MAG: LD-carboxypeptidase [Candidatus Pacebacteria bacterium]|nr:LD-carboxypeptidase [Candidatus Paceibacterota bacterium]
MVYEKGLENLKKYFGFNTKGFSNTIKKYNDKIDYVYDRVADIHAAFLDNDVEAIFITIGGSDSIRLLPYLDKDILLNNPKIVLGFSDSTSILVYLAKLGMPAFYGPSVMAGFAEPDGLKEEFISHFKSFFFDSWDTYKYPIYSEWTEDRYGWTDPNFLNRTKKYIKNDGPNVLKKGQVKEGILFGGCLEVLEMLKGTPYGIDFNDYENMTFFFETSEDKPSLDYVECCLTNYGVAGAWNKVVNLIVSKSRGYTYSEYKSLEDILEKVIYTRFDGKTENIITNIDIGHTQPMMIFPLGCKFKIESNQIILTESPFIN